MKKKWIAGLGGLLVIQIVLAVALNMGSDSYGAFTPNEKLAGFAPAQVDAMLIETADKKAVLKKTDGEWQLPELDNFPADQRKVTQLIDTLAALKRGWPVATTASAAKRFKVDEDEFERRITLEHGGDTVAQLYFGTSPGLRKVHARTADDDEIVAVDFSLFEAGADNTDWIDNEVLKLDEKKIMRAEFPGFTLQRQDGKWQLAQLAPDEKTITDNAGELIKKLAGLTVESLFAAGDNPELEKNTNPLKITVVLDDDSRLDYTVSKLEGSGYLLQRSDQPTRYKAADWEINPLKDAERKKLVETVESVESPADETGDKPEDSK